MLKGDEGALVAAAVAGRTLEEIAVAADVSVSTAQRRLRDPDISALIEQGRTDCQRQAVGRLNSELNETIDKLRALVHHNDPNVALRAIDKLIAHAYRFNRDASALSRAETADEGGR